MTGAPALTRLLLTLPPEWEVMVDAADDAPSDPALGAAVNLAQHSFAHGGRKPDVTAGLVAAVDASGVATVLIATLTAWVYTTNSLPKLPPDSSQPSVIRGVLVAPDAPVDFLVLSCRVDSSDGLTTGLLHFSSPNLPLQEELVDTFRAIASTARLGPVVEDA